MSARKLVLILFIVMLMSGCTKPTENPVEDNPTVVDNPSGQIADNNQGNTSNDNNDNNNETDIQDKIDATLEVDKIIFIENVKSFFEDENYMIFDSEEQGQKVNEIYQNSIASSNYHEDKPITVDDVRLVNAKVCLDVFDKMTVDDNTGVSLISLVDGLGLKQAKTYMLFGKNNFSIGVARENLDNGILYQNSDGSYCARFEGMSDRTIVKDILYIAIEE